MSTEATAKTIRATLRNLGAEVELGAITEGAQVTRYELIPAAGTKVAQVQRAEADLAVALGAESVRVTSRGALAVEVPASQRQIVPLDALTATMARDHPLRVPVGLTVDGQGVSARLDRLPHLLVAGTTGSGKSAWISAVLADLISHARPDQVRIDAIDPKVVELAAFAAAPQVGQIVTETDEAIDLLTELAEDMQARYKTMASHGVRNVAELDSPPPYRLLVIDELADLIMQAKKAVEAPLVRILQKGRAAGLHVILGTQRPSAEVLSGLIRANVPSRLTFAVQSHQDSTIALGQTGAEALLGAGDGLWWPSGASAPERIQAPWLDTPGIEAAVADAAGPVLLADNACMATDERGADHVHVCDRDAGHGGLHACACSHHWIGAGSTAPTAPTPAEPDYDGDEQAFEAGYADALAGRPPAYPPGPEPQVGASDEQYQAHNYRLGYAVGSEAPPVPQPVPEVQPVPREPTMQPVPEPARTHAVRPYRRPLRAADVWVSIGVALAVLVIATMALPVAPFALAAIAAVAVARRRRRAQYDLVGGRP